MIDKYDHKLFNFSIWCIILFGKL